VCGCVRVVCVGVCVYRCVCVSGVCMCGVCVWVCVCADVNVQSGLI